MLRSPSVVAILIPGVAALVAGTAAGSQLPTEIGATVRLADAAHVRFDVRAEHTLLQHAAGLDAPAWQLAAVERRLALVEWKYFGLVGESRSRLQRAARGVDPALAWLELARLEQAQDDWAAARLAADQALLTADTAALRDAASLALARAAVGAMAEKRRRGDDTNPPAAAGVLADLRAIVAEEPGRLEPARLLLNAGLLSDDGEAALEGFRAYYHVFPGTPLPNAVAPAAVELQALLVDFAVRRADPEYLSALVRALAGTRMIEAAALVAHDARLRQLARDDADLEVLRTYAASIRQLRIDVHEYYRRTILGEYEPEALDRAVRRAAEPVWQALHGPLDETVPTLEELRATLERRFGAVVRLSRTSRRYDLLMGHVVEDEERDVEQYGRQARVRFVALDSMVTRGFRDWAWEHRQGAVGFASASTLTQVRPAYVPEALAAWRLASDSRARALHERRIAQESRTDDARASSNPHGFLPGLALRLQHQGRLQLLGELEALGFAGDDLRAAYLRRFQETMRQSSIFAHEGRHAMDLRDGNRYHREFTAKLSEVAFAEYPRLAFSGILDETIGNGTFHGTGNLMLMEGLVRWIEEHRDDIDGFDATRPVLPQLDLLSDEQLRQACRDLDPYLNAAASDGPAASEARS